MALDTGGFPLAGTPLMVAPDGTVRFSYAYELGAGQTGFLFNWAVAPSTAKLIDLQVDNTSKFSVSSSGLVSATTFAGPDGTSASPAVRIGSVGPVTFGIYRAVNTALTFTRGDFDFLTIFPTYNYMTWLRDFRVGWSNSDTSVTTTDTMLCRSAAAVIQQGDANAASPVAQTLQSQGSRSGTDTNVGGANYTIRSGTGTGTGALSSLILQSPIAVASGTGAQTQTTGLTIKQGCFVSVGYTVATLPATPATGSRAHVTDANATTFLSTVAAGGANVVPVFYDGANWVIA